MKHGTTGFSLVAVVAAAACGPSAAQVETARAARYTCDAREVYVTVAEELGERDDVMLVDPGSGVVVTRGRWHSRSGQARARSMAGVGAGDLNIALIMRVRHESDGWHLTPEPLVRVYAPEGPQDAHLERGRADWPGWIDAKVDAIMVDIHGSLEHCAVDPGA